MFGVEHYVIVVFLNVVRYLDIVSCRDEYLNSVLAADLNDLLDLLRELRKHQGQWRLWEKVVKEGDVTVDLHSLLVVDVQQLVNALLFAGVIIGDEAMQAVPTSQEQQ